MVEKIWILYEKAIRPVVEALCNGTLKLTEISISEIRYVPFTPEPEKKIKLISTTYRKKN